MHQHIHRVAAIEREPLLRQSVHAKECILYGDDNGRVHTRRYEVIPHGRELPELIHGELTLGDMRIHLVAVKVGILWRRHRHIQAKRVLGQHHHPMGHHRGAMERRLPIEKHRITVDEMAMNDIPELELHRPRPRHAQRLRRILARPLNRLRSRLLVGSGIHETLEPLNVVTIHPLRIRQVHRNLHGDTEFLYRDVRVTRNHRPRREIHPLPH